MTNPGWLVSQNLVRRWLIMAWMVGSALGARADGLIVVHDSSQWPNITPPSPGPPAYVFAPLQVVYHHVNARIDDQVAVTTVDQEFHNPSARRLEGTYLFPVPPGAQIDKFSMDINGQQVEAELMAADKALKIYEDIVRKSKDPALLEYAGRDVFKVRIFPIEPNSRKKVKLSYTQVLKSDAGVVNYVYPLNTEKYSAKPIESVSLKIKLSSRLPLKTIYSPSHEAEIKRHGENQATIGFEAKQVKPDTDFQLMYAAQKGDIGLHLLTHRPEGEDGFFLLLATPAFELKQDQITPKDVVFVLDTSGSMSGKKLLQAKKAFQFCVENLNDSDRFELIRFSTETESLFQQLVKATENNRAKAEAFIKDLKPMGGTAIDEALKQALSLGNHKTDRPYMVVFLTDGLPTVGTTDEKQILQNVTRNLASSSLTAAARIFCFGVGTDVNTHLLDKITEAAKGYSQYVLPEEDIEIKVSNFYTKIKDPVLSNVKITYPDGIRTRQTYPNPLPDLFRGEQLILAGRFSGYGQGSLSLQGKLQGESKTSSYPVEFEKTSAQHDFLPRLWATRRVGYLLEEIRLHGENKELREEVAGLARQYGIVTPYTAYLIMEDEKQHNVPLSVQSLPQLNEDRRAVELLSRNYYDQNVKRSGEQAVMMSRYGLTAKSANQAASAVGSGAQQAERSLRSYGMAPGRAGVAVQPGPLVERTIATVQQNRFVAGRNWFQNGRQWIDPAVQNLASTNRTRIQFNSTEYFDLIAKNPEVAPWLALGQNVLFAWKDKVYEIHE